MPDRELNDDGTVVDLDTPATRGAAIANCALCDRDGYRGTVVCDHKHRAPGPGRAAMAAELAKIRHRKVERAKQPYRTAETTEEGNPA